MLLAAGASRRFGDENKLLVEIEGVPLVRRAAEQLVSSRVDRIIAVTGYEADLVRAALTGLDLQFAENTHYARGMASSIKCGLAILGENASGAMIVLADMPGTRQALLNELIGIFEEEHCEKIVYPEREDGSQGNPVIWPSRYFSELRKLQGDVGARHLIRQYRDATQPVRVKANSVLDDIDTPGDLEI